MPIARWIVLTAGLAFLAAPLQGQREYRVETSLGGSYTTFDKTTELAGSVGGAGRLGYWLWRKLSIEVEAGFAAPSSENGETVNVTTLGGAALFNIPLGLYSSLFLKGGYGSVGYGSCPENVAPSTICGSTGAILAGAGIRLALSPTVMLRTEATVANSSSPSFANLSVGAGLSFMLASRHLTDTDQDGVYDRYDRCASTPVGALVDGRGCPTDNDGDGVADGIDRCPQSPAGARVDAIGCPQDADRDNVLDGIDRCPDTPPGAAVDQFGCPSDSDNDKVLDGLDRCPNTPAGATVDRLGCPGDEDNDRVFDGIDRCPGTPPGTTVNTFGCPPTLDSDRDGVPDAADLCPGTPANTQVDVTGCPRSAPEPPAPTAPEVGQPGPWVVPGQAFALQRHDIRDVAFPQLDSIAAYLVAHPTLRVEIVGNAHDRLPPSDNMKLSLDRAQAIRVYLISRGVRGEQLRIKGNGANRLLVQDTSAEARVRNRRTEINPIGE